MGRKKTRRKRNKRVGNGYGTAENIAYTDFEPGLTLCDKCGSSKHKAECCRCKLVYFYCGSCRLRDYERLDICRSCLTNLDKGEKNMLKSFTTREVTTDSERLPGLGETQFYTHNREPLQSPFMEPALIRAKRPVGSLESAIQLAERAFPSYQIITKFDELTVEEFPPFPFRLLPRHRSVLVAFMYQYHEHVMRHGVYLKDSEDNESMVLFYLNRFNDNPLPYFSYSEIKPGSYICITDPSIHYFLDGTVGFRIDDPSRVKVIDASNFMPSELNLCPCIMVAFVVAIILVATFVAFLKWH